MMEHGRRDKKISSTHLQIIIMVIRLGTQNTQGQGQGQGQGHQNGTITYYERRVTVCPTGYGPTVYVPQPFVQSAGPL